ncbi:MAG: hypothetical protein RLZZ618_2056 [Pseudomonadota bacterium]|jgi:GNAT superfamily N-acetyltransferase
MARATPAHVPGIGQLIRRLSRPFLLHPSGEGAERFLASVSDEAILGFVTAENFVYLVAEVDGRLAGVVAVRDRTHLFHLFVDLAFQKQGLGRALWQRELDAALHPGHLGKFTVNASLNAVPVYTRFGFVTQGPVVHANGVAFQPMQLMREHLGPTLP